MATDAAPQSVIFDGFENGSAESVFAGDGSFYLKKGEAKLLDQTLNNSQTGHYELSFWLYVDSRIYDMPKATLKIFEKNGEQSYYKQLNTRQVHDVYKGWVRISEEIDIHPEQTLQLLIKGKYVSVDNLLARPAEANVFIQQNNMEAFNNFPFEN